MALQTSSIGCLKLSRPRRHWPLLLAMTMLALATLACAFLGSGSRSRPDQVAIIRRLPALTRTPLPTLSPTLIPSSDQAAALAAEPVLVAPTPTPVPVPTFTLASSEVAASTSPAAPANSGPTLTALVTLNVRAGPGVDYPVVGQLGQGQSTQIRGRTPEGTWWQVVYPPDSEDLAWVIADVQYAIASGVEAVQIAQLPRSTPATPPSSNGLVTHSIPPSASTDVSPSQTTTPSENPINSPTPPFGSSSWTFTGVRLYFNQGVGLVAYGNAINNSGAAQELRLINGTFYNEQGQVIATADQTSAYWPAHVVPAGGNVPFELLVDNIDNAARFNLGVVAEPSSEVPRQNFEFSAVNQRNELNTYCVGGEVQTPHEGFKEYLILAVVLYDAQNNVVNFGDYGEFGQGAGSANDGMDFEICVNPPNQEVARYELKAWGL